MTEQKPRGNKAYCFRPHPELDVALSEEAAQKGVTVQTLLNQILMRRYKIRVTLNVRGSLKKGKKQ